MTKVNFAKIEAAVEARLRKMSVEQLLKLTKQEPEGSDPSREIAAHSLLLAAEWLHRQGINLKKEFGISHAEIKKRLSSIENINTKEWPALIELCQKMRQYIKTLLSETVGTNDELIAKERKRHINKRFNVNEKWLPLK